MTYKKISWLDYVPSILTSILFISQIILGIYFLSDVNQIEFLAYFGIGLYFFSGFIFGMLPIFEFRKKGGVKKGKSYINTTKIVNTGLYSTVRHPQYVTFIMFAIAGMLLFQHWLVILLGITIVVLTYIDLFRADKELIAKFGSDYKKYKEKVPRANFVLGIIRRLRHRNRKKQAGK